MRYNKDAAIDVLPAGPYEAVVKVAKEKVSKAGNPMIELILTVYGPKGFPVDVFDYLLSTDSFQWKVRHFCESAGLDYNRGELTEDQCQDQNVKVNLSLKKDEYGEKNIVQDYLPRATPVTVYKPKEEELDKDVPF